MFEKNCDYCGKVFFPTKYHAYKELYNGSTKWFCRYTCMLRYRDKHKRKNTKNIGGQNDHRTSN